jgi:hypothetical protein
LPGENLYPVKRTWEDVRLLLVFDAEGREELEDEYENERLEEISELLAESRLATVSFDGVVEQIVGDRWLVSGIVLQIDPDSDLPAEPVTVGNSVTVIGRTNSDGFVEVERVELLAMGVSLQPAVTSGSEGPLLMGASEDSDSGDDNDSGNITSSDDSEGRSGSDRDKSSDHDDDDD